jgi:hypothetical protein
MADEKSFTGLNLTAAQRTESGWGAPPPPPPLDLSGTIHSIGVGLTAGEIAELEKIGATLGDLLGTEPVTRNALMRHAIRQFLLAYHAGKITPEELARNWKAPKKAKPAYQP